MVEKYIKRHSFLARFTHGTAAICCILLIFSGIFVFVPAANAWAGPEFTIAMRWLHRLAAIPFILVPLYAFFFSLKGAKIGRAHV